MSVNGNVQYGRVAQVIVGTAGVGLEITELRMEFKITKTLTAEPNSAVLKIYNLSADHETQIQKEFTDVLINAGYVGAVRLVFRGTIKHVFKYKKGLDHITEIEVGDGDKDLRNSLINTTLAAGTTDHDLVSAVVKTFSETSLGYVNIDQRKRFKGRAVFGSGQHVLSTLARAHGANWSIQDGQLQIVKAESVLPDQAIVVNAQTGMLKAPEISDKGITVSCLMNPQMRPNGTVKLDNNDIKLKTHHAEQKKAAHGSLIKTRKPTGPIRLDPDGLYKIIRIDHDCDTRGPKWTSEILCIGLGQPIPQEAIGVYGGDESAE